MKFIWIFIILISFHNNSYSFSVIRDFESEKAIKQITNPILKVAGLNINDVKIFIINNKELNAFVSEGQNIFINSGLILLSKKPDILAGVIAHETGHIAGAHLTRNNSELKNTYIKLAIGYALGMIASVTSNSPEAAMAILTSGSQIATLEYLKYSRIEEESADQAALKYLSKANYPNRGLLELLKIFYRKEVTLYSDINKYALTHPLSKSRIVHIENYIKNTKKNNFPSHITEDYGHIFAKVQAFTLNPHETLNLYPKENKTPDAQYARSIAYYKMSDIKNSFKELDNLIKNEPKNSFFYELKAQILFENQKIEESVMYYKKALKLLPNNTLAKIQLSVAIIALENKSLYKEAIINLESALLEEPSNKYAWHQLGIVYGKEGKIGKSNLALAEKSLIEGNKEDALKYIKSAKKYLKKETSSYLHLKDLEAYIQNINK